MLDKSVDILSENREFAVEALTILTEHEGNITKTRHLHVAFARIMQLNNYLQSYSSKIDNQAQVAQARLTFAFLLQALYPYAPHLTSELWDQL